MELRRSRRLAGLSPMQSPIDTDNTKKVVTYPDEGGSLTPIFAGLLAALFIYAWAAAAALGLASP